MEEDSTEEEWIYGVSILTRTGTHILGESLQVHFGFADFDDTSEELQLIC